MDLNFCAFVLLSVLCSEQWHGFEKGGERRKLGARGACEQMRDAQVTGATKLIVHTSFLIGLPKHSSSLIGLKTLFVSIRILFHFESFEAFLK